MKEIGGYIEFEHYYNKMLHEDGIKLNCGRNCLAYLIEAKKIDKIWIPYFMCASIKEISSAYPVEFKFYFVGKNLMPIEESLDRWEKNDYLYLMNYYGQMTECDLRDIKGKYKLQRFKGLGEMNANELYETTMDPNNRRLLRVNLTDAAIAEKRIHLLMGDQVEPRKEWINENVDFTLEDSFRK